MYTRRVSDALAVAVDCYGEGVGAHRSQTAQLEVGA